MAPLSFATTIWPPWTDSIKSPRVTSTSGSGMEMIFQVGSGSLLKKYFQQPLEFPEVAVIVHEDFFHVVLGFLIGRNAIIFCDGLRSRIVRSQG
jgi:hypothetical protein